MSHKKFGPDRFSRFVVYWIQTDRQTDKLNLYIDSGYTRKDFPRRLPKYRRVIKQSKKILKNLENNKNQIWPDVRRGRGEGSQKHEQRRYAEKPRK